MATTLRALRTFVFCFLLAFTAIIIHWAAIRYLEVTITVPVTFPGEPSEILNT